MMSKYPDIEIQLSGQDGNAFHILGVCMQAMRRAGLSQSERDEFQNQATSGDYNHLLATCVEWFEVN